MLEKMKLRYKIIIGMVIILACGIVGEVLFNAPLLLGRKEAFQSLDLSKVELSGFELIDGELVCTEKGISHSADVPGIIIHMDKQYIGKLRFHFDSWSKLRAVISIDSYTGYGDPLLKEIEDNNNIVYSESVVNIRNQTNKIKISFPDFNQDADSDASLKISDITLDNRVSLSVVRMAFVCIAAFLILFLIFFKETVTNHIERVFVVFAVAMGLILTVALPEHKIGWDEEIHFNRAYSLSEAMIGHDQALAYPAIHLLMVNSYQNWPDDRAGSKEEHFQEIHYLNANGVYWEREDSEDNYHELNIPGMATIGYIPQALMLLFAKLFRLPFALVYLAGRLGNLFLYSIVMYFAIKKMPIGKRILTAISLLPTLMFLTGVYAYDIMVYAFIALSIAYILHELLHEEQKITYKNYIIICASMVIGCASKAVYIPLILLMLFLPKAKFKDKKQMYIMKGIIAGVFLAMMATFVLPSAGGEMAGDERGGELTSVSGQLRMIFRYPFAYAAILLKSIKDTLGAYVFGTESLGYMGHMLMVRFQYFIPIFLGVIMVTDTAKDKAMKLKIQYKAVSAVLILGVMSLIWTALYLSFTSVGATVIQGVQGRYYLPLLPLIYLILNTDKIQNHIPERIYNILVVGGAALVTMSSIFVKLISTYY
jgi:uncharacterized membrane protein